MDKIAQLLAILSPSWAAARVTGQAKLAAAQRYYEAVKITAQRPKRGGPQAADAVMDAAKGNMREFARNLDENHDLSIGVLNDLVTNVVGVGAGIEPMVVRGAHREPAEDLNRLLDELWNEFWASPEMTGELSGSDVERLVCRTWLRDGEVFIQHVIAPRAPYGSRIPYGLELLESDFLPYDLVRPADRIVHGVQKDGWGRPVGYWFNKVHPGAMTFSAQMAEVLWKPAEAISHLKFTRRLHQTRGVSIFHGVLTRLDDLKDYEESERIAARVAAALTAFIKRDIGLSSDAAVAGEDSLVTGRSFAMEPGLVFDGLLPGEDVGTIDSKRPNPNLEAFRNGQLRAIAAGTGTRFSAVARDFNGTYSAQRQELVEGVAHYRMLFTYLRNRFYLPVWRRFVDASRLAGLLRVPAGVDLASLYRPEIRPPNMPWIDPLKEIKAFQMMVESGFRSRHQIIRDLGSDPATVDAQLEADPLDIRPLADDPMLQAWLADQDEPPPAGEEPEQQEAA
jgi:lambda family phage portal protein